LAKLYTILAILGWSFVPVFFAFVWWRMKRLKVSGRHGFEVVGPDEKQR